MARVDFHSAKENAEWCDPKEPVSGMTVKHIGKGPDGLWYGWSHRAFHGFKSRKQASKFAHSVS